MNVISRIVCTLMQSSLLIALSIPCLADGGATVPLDSLKIRYEQEGIKAVDDMLDRLRSSGDADTGVVRAFVDLSVDLFQSGQRQEGIDVLEKTRLLFLRNKLLYSVLGQYYWYTEDRDRCIQTFRTALSIDSTMSTARRYMDLLVFIPENFTPPESLVTKHFKIRPLTASDVELDYKAVMGSREHLRGVFGPDDDWPSDSLTQEGDLAVLKNHEAEHRRRAAFTYTVMNHEETECMGCIYICPVHLNEFDAQVYVWVTKDAFDRGWDAELYRDLRNWLSEKWPFNSVAYPGREIDWTTWNTFKEY